MIPIVRLNRIDFSYRPDRPLFSKLELSCFPNQKIGIWGRNGSGKSTILKLITGLVRPQNGSIVFHGQECCSESEFAKLRRQVGLVFQDPVHQLFCPSVRQDLAFGPSNLKWADEKIEKSVESVSRFFNLTPLLDRVPFHLSGGEQHLVALAGVVVMEPKLLLLDEPFEWLDDEHRERVVSYLNEMAPGFIMIAQDQELLKSMCPDGVWEINDYTLQRLK